MKVVILAGGLGTRISEESHLRPKPMIEIGGYPLIWHIMKIYSHYGYNDFIVCLGYKGYIIKEYFANYLLHNSNLTLRLSSGDIEYHTSSVEPWSVTLVDTGQETMTGGRLKKIQSYLPKNVPFLCTYGDGVSDVNVRDLVQFHASHGKAASLTAVTPPGRYGALELDDQKVSRFVEKPPGDKGQISGGFFVFDYNIFDRIEDDSTVLEAAPLEGLAADQQLMAYPHRGFWAAMDTLRDKRNLEELWMAQKAPWKIW